MLDSFFESGKSATPRHKFILGLGEFSAFSVSSRVWLKKAGLVLDGQGLPGARPGERRVRMALAPVARPGVPEGHGAGILAPLTARYGVGVP